MWPEWASVLGRRIDYLSPTLFLTDIVFLLMLVFWLIDRVRHRAEWSLRKKYTPLRYILVAAVFIGVNVLVAESQAVAIYKWLKVVEMALLGWYIISTNPKTISVVWYISLGVLYSSILAITQFVFQHSVGGIFWILGERTFSLDTPGISRFDFCLFTHASCSLLLRPYGTFSHPNVLGGFLATALPIIFSMLLTSATKRVTGRIYYWTVLALGLVALLLTFSRSAWIVGGFGFVVTAVIFLSGKYFHVRKRAFQNNIMVIIPIIICLTWLSITFFPSATSESIVRRAELNRAAVDMWHDSPIVGKGLGNFLVTLPESDVSRYVNFIQPVHNIFLLALSEIGIVGVFLVAISFWYVARKTKIYRNRYLLFAAFGYFFLIGSIDHYPITLQQGQLWSVVLLGLILKRLNS